jgi:hypothetical protein
MKPNIVVIRAITVEFARQFIQPFVWIVLGIIVFLLLITGVLAFTVSQWWWLLAIPIIAIGLIGATIWIIVRLIAKRISPQLNTQQKVAVRQFIDKLRFVVETARTPYPIIVLIVIKDLITRKENGIIQEMATQSKTLRPDFEELRKLF